MNCHRFAPFFSALLFVVSPAVAGLVQVASPDGRHVLRVSDEGGMLRYAITSDGAEVIAPTAISITIDGVTRPESAKISGFRESRIARTVTPVVPTIGSSLAESCHEGVVSFGGGVALRCRAYDDGVAFRWETTLDAKQVTVNAESLAFSFAKDFQVHFPEPNGEGFFSHQENKFHWVPVSKTAGMKVACTPLLVERGGGKYLLISDVDVEGYPGIWVHGTDTTTLTAVFPPYPLETKLDGDRNDKVTKAADFLARTAGTRSYPWRAFVLADAKGLLTSTMLYHLAAPSRLADTSWIKPGKVAWDWWNYNTIYGVPFRAGVNQETYKHYIDFAAETGLPYIILDEGWSQAGAENLLMVVPEIRMQELADYGRSKGVGLVLWMTSAALERNFEAAFAQFSKWGIVGLKVDFMQRDDQPMMDFLYRTAETGAEHRMLLDFPMWKDGPNADRNGCDVAVESSKVTARSVLKVHLAPGGGVAAMITPAE